jgi:hypothetical protein
MLYPEKAREIDEGYTDMGIIVVHSISNVWKSYIVPFFIPSKKITNKIDKD